MRQQQSKEGRAETSIQRLLKWPSVGIAAVVPAGFPAFFPSFRWGKCDPAREHAFSGGGKFPCGRCASSGISHVTEHLHESPAVSLVPLGGLNALTFKIDVVDER